MNTNCGWLLQSSLYVVVPVVLAACRDHSHIIPSLRDAGRQVSMFSVSPHVMFENPSDYGLRTTESRTLRCKPSYLSLAFR
jgi:hypothetical protein